MPSYAILGSTGNCGSALVQNLLRNPSAKIHAYCRNAEKLQRLLPQTKGNKQVEVFEGSISDLKLLSSCVAGCQAVFVVVSTNDNIPGCRLSQVTVTALIRVLEGFKNDGAPIPRLILLSSCSTDEYLSRHSPWLLRAIVHCSASHVYHDLMEAEKMLRAQDGWLTTIFMKPGALSVDKQRGHALSLTDEESPVSYLDLAAAMIEAVDDDQGTYDNRSVSVINTNGKASFPAGTPMCILMGLLRHFFPFLHPYLPLNTGPK